MSRRILARTLLVAVFGFLTFSIYLDARGEDRWDNTWKRLDQGVGWNSEEWSKWYTRSQGSRLMPLSWANALERPDSTEKFLSPANISAFNYLPNPDPRGLPIGFAVDSGDRHQERGACHSFPTMCADGRLREDWVGFNCAACHTNVISYKGSSWIIDGAPTLADFQGFFEQMLHALTQTAEDGRKFDRFANEVLQEKRSTQADARLKADLDELVRWEQRVSDKNATPLRYGFGRLDAQGHILNKVSLLVGATDPLTGYPADAPASYPFLWNVSQHHRVQWNGIAKNNINYALTNLSTGKKRETSLGALGRNIGEVIGVFGQVDTDRKEFLIGGYRSTIRTDNLIDLERQLRLLKPPAWPFGSIDQMASERGRKIFDERCASCHHALDRNDTASSTKEKMISLEDIGTDVWLACNTYLHRSKTGDLDGRRTGLLFSKRFDEISYTKDMLEHTIERTIIGERKEIEKKALDDVFGVEPPPKQLAVAAPPPPPPPPPGYRPPDYLPGISDQKKKDDARLCIVNSENDLSESQDDKRFNYLGYKARSLSGIWATAPYLHNGSVPTLYDLFLPSNLRNVIRDPGGVPTCNKSNQCRPEVFYVGTREFDPRKVGFVSDGHAGGVEFRVRKRDGTPILGNYNSGHEGFEFGTDLRDDERWDLVEYLKTL